VCACACANMRVVYAQRLGMRVVFARVRTCVRTGSFVGLPFRLLYAAFSS